VSGTGRGFASAPLKKHKRWAQWPWDKTRHHRKMRMMRLSITIFLLISLVTFKTNGQENKQLNWQEQLKSCEVEIPLYYATKNQPKLVESAEKYKDVELVLVIIDKKKGTTYKSYYLERYQSDFGPSAYLVKSRYINQERRPEHVIFLNYNPKKHIFYNADCFRKNPISKDLKSEE